ncbi:hypothetical protein TWF696_001305 [Orbilia brochopaga]|uniref:Rhodanese domain-containing protein n=1 Tax=Orbilia brochopaga TaxID=3140254 RepID=A0AAV9UB15_9PEZI
MEPLRDWIRNDPLGQARVNNQNANAANNQNVNPNVGQQGQLGQIPQGLGQGMQAPVQQNVVQQGNVQRPNFNYMPRIFPNLDPQQQPQNTYNTYIPNQGTRQQTIDTSPYIFPNTNEDANANHQSFVFSRYGLDPNQNMMQVPTYINTEPQGTSRLLTTEPQENRNPFTAARVDALNFDELIIDDYLETRPTQGDESRIDRDVTNLLAINRQQGVGDSGIGSETEWDFGIGDTEERFPSGGRIPSGRISSTVANTALNSRGEVRTIAPIGASRDSLSEGVQYYQERLTGRIRPLRQLEYDPEINRSLLNPLLAPAWRVIRVFAEQGVHIGRIRAPELYDYITRPGIRPRNYLILDMRGDDPDIVRMDNMMREAEGQVRTIPFSADRSQLTDDQIRALGRGEALSDDFCDREAVRVFQEIANSDVEYVIVHCTYGQIRSPAAAIALQMLVGARKRILLLEGGIAAFEQYIGNREAQLRYRTERDQREREREEAARQAREQRAEQARKRIEDDLLAAGNTDYLNLPDSPEISFNRGIPQNFGNISPQNRVLILGQHHSNIPLEEEDREETIQRDGELFLQHLRSEPAPRTGCSRRGGRATGDDPFGDNQGGPGSPGQGGGRTGGGLGGGPGGLRKRGLDFMNGSKSAILQGQSWGIFKPEKRGKGMRVVKRM